MSKSSRLLGITEETRRLVTVTKALGLFSLLAFVGTITVIILSHEQVLETQAALVEQRRYDSLQLRRDSLKTWNDSIFSAEQLSSLRRQVGISDSTAKRQLRAYLGFEEATALDTTDYAIQLVFVNHGQTPAYHIKNIHAAIGGNGLKESEFVFHDSNGRLVKVFNDQGVLDPHVSTLIPFNPPDITDSDRILLKKGFGGIYYYGIITYSDVFGNQDTTGFRIKLHFERGDKIYIGPAEGNGNYEN